MSRVMSRSVMAALAVSAAFAAPAFAEGYKVIDRIKLPDGGWDYITSDAARGLIYRTRTDGADVIDVKTGKVSQLANTGNGHMVVVVAGTTLGVLPLRQPVQIRRLGDRIAIAADSRVEIIHRDEEHIGLASLACAAGDPAPKERQGEQGAGR